jgi:hypothetical protein
MPPLGLDEYAGEHRRTGYISFRSSQPKRSNFFAANAPRHAELDSASMNTVREAAPQSTRHAELDSASMNTRLRELAPSVFMDPDIRQDDSSGSLDSASMDIVFGSPRLAIAQPRAGTWPSAHFAGAGDLPAKGFYWCRV